MGGVVVPEICIRLYPNEELSIDESDGTETLYGSDKVFTGGVDRCFPKWGIDIPSGKPTPRAIVKMFQVVWKTTLAEIFQSLVRELNSAVLEQGQIKNFVHGHPEKLATSARPTFFLYKVREEFLVAHVRLANDKKPEVLPHRFWTDEYEWDPDQYRPRVVILGGVVRHV